MVCWDIAGTEIRRIAAPLPENGRQLSLSERRIWANHIHLPTGNHPRIPFLRLKGPLLAPISLIPSFPFGNLQALALSPNPFASYTETFPVGWLLVSADGGQGWEPQRIQRGGKSALSFDKFLLNPGFGGELETRDVKSESRRVRNWCDSVPSFVGTCLTPERSRASSCGNPQIEGRVASSPLTRCVVLHALSNSVSCDEFE